MAMRASAIYVGQRVDHAAIRETFRGENGPVGDYLNDATRRVRTAAQTYVGVKSGLLLSTIRREPMGQGPRGPYRDVAAGRRGLTDYLGDHMFGTEPHVIRPRRRRALRFVSGGRVIYATKVRHPGTKGTHFLTRALDVLD